MTQAEVYRRQAEVLRLLAGSFDIPEIRRDLCAIAAFCQELADTAQESGVAEPWVLAA